MCTNKTKQKLQNAILSTCTLISLQMQREKKADRTLLQLKQKGKQKKDEKDKFESSSNFGYTNIYKHRRDERKKETNSNEFAMIPCQVLSEIGTKGTLHVVLFA